MAALLATLGPVFVVLQYCGGAYLVWLGTVRWRKAGRVVLADDTDADRPAVREAGLGMAMTLSNPIAVAFYLALLPGIIDVSDVDVVDYLTMAAIIAIVMTAVVLSYGGAGELVRRYCAGSRARVVTDRIGGCILCAAGFWVALR